MYKSTPFSIDRLSFAEPWPMRTKYRRMARRFRTEIVHPIEFDSVDALALFIGLPVNDEPGFPPTISVEADWGIYRGAGYGLPGGRDGGWMVTFTSPSNTVASIDSTKPDGYLIAYACDLPGPNGVMNKRSGRCLLLAGPRSVAEDNAARAKIAGLSQNYDISNLHA
jgi:hypothetical protein